MFIMWIWHCLWFDPASGIEIRSEQIKSPKSKRAEFLEARSAPNKSIPFFGILSLHIDCEEVYVNIQFDLSDCTLSTENQAVVDAVNEFLVLLADDTDPKPAVLPHRNADN